MFKLIYNILFKKNKDLQFEEDGFSFYLFQRWLTMCSPKVATTINETSNRLFYNLQDNENWYKFFMIALPKDRYKKLNYIKKAKKEKVNIDKEEEMNILANQMEISKREIKELIKQGDLICQ